MRNFKVFIFLFVFFLVLHLVSSEIYILEEPLDSYNVGDELNFSFLVYSKLPYHGFVDCDFYCNDDFQKKIFRNSINLGANSSKNFDVSFFLDSPGNCYVKISAINKKEETSAFLVSNEIKLKVFLNSKEFFPNQTLKINGSVKKENSKNFDYSLSLKLSNFSEKKYYFNSQNFYINYTFPSDIPAKNYSLVLNIEEKDIFGKLINSASYTEEIKIFSVPTSLFINSGEEFKPPYNYSVVISLLDQSGRIIKGEDILIRLLSPKDYTIISQKIIKSGDNFSYFFLPNSTLGGWKLKAIYGSLYMEKLIQIQENKLIKINLTENNSKLIIKNLGNVEYNSPIELKLSNAYENSNSFLNLSIPVGGFYEYNFPKNGTYNVTIGNQTFYNVQLTGAVVSGQGFFKSSHGKIVLLFFVLIVLGVFFILFFQKTKHKCKKIKQKKIRLIKKHKQKEISKIAPLNLAKKTLKEKKESNLDINRVYALFFKQNVSLGLKKILEKYGLRLHKFKGIYFTMFKSNKNFENSLFKISKMIYENSENKSILIHSAEFKKDVHILESFLKFKKVFEIQEKGIFVSQNIYEKLNNKIEFKNIGVFNNKNFWVWKS